MPLCEVNHLFVQNFVLSSVPSCSKKTQTRSWLNLVNSCLFLLLRSLLRMIEDGGHQPRQLRSCSIGKKKKRMLLISVFKRTMTGHQKSLRALLIFDFSVSFSASVARARFPRWSCSVQSCVESKRSEWKVSKQTASCCQFGFLLHALFRLVRCGQKLSCILIGY